jgi:hypothetical protein
MVYQYEQVQKAQVFLETIFSLSILITKEKMIKSLKVLSFIAV